MKKLTIEQKAKAYDEAIKRANSLLSSNELGNAWIYKLLPELAGSEDERMVKFIKNQLFNIKKTITENYELDVKLTKAIDWLEKQGEQFYIRFGEIPTDEKSKIYQGEVEVGTENGVSVYPAFETNEGDIVLGLNLPITKTTLYTQQHLLEYEDRPCYLVKGNYVGKDTDGQPLIDNVHIIRKIDSYRVKEEKVDNKTRIEPSDKVEPKFRVGDTMRTLQEATDGYTDGMPVVVSIDKEYYHCTNELIAIKDQDDYEFPPMNRKHDVCDSCDEQKPAWSEEDENIKESIITGLEMLKDGASNQSLIALYNKKIDWLKSLKDRMQPKPKQEWSEGDETYSYHIITAIKSYYTDDKGEENPWREELLRWLKSLKERVQPQPKQKWSEEDINMLQSILDEYKSMPIEKRNWLKSLKDRNTWKPSDEQITWLYRATDEAKKDSRMKQVLNELLSDLKKLKAL